MNLSTSNFREHRRIGKDFFLKDDSPSHSSTTTNTATNVLDSFHDLFLTTSASQSNILADSSDINLELANVFSSPSSSNGIPNTVMTNENIMALFNTSRRMRSKLIVDHHTECPSISDSPSVPAYPSLASSKSHSFDSNPLQPQVRPSFVMNHHPTNRINTPSAFTPEQVTTSIHLFLSTDLSIFRLVKYSIFSIVIK